ncbi:MAG: DMT family transporter, partial [bacterium]|nr:DMT family transporter [bacterium]
VIFMPELRGANASVLGVSLAIASAAAYGIYTVMGRRLTMRRGSPVTNSFSFIIGSLLTLPVMIHLGVPQFFLPLKALPAIAYLGIFVSGVAYLTFFIGLSRTEAGRGSMVFFIKPVLAGILAAVLLSEPLTLSLISGTVFILGGLFVVNLVPGRTQAVVSSRSTNIR